MFCKLQRFYRFSNIFEWFNIPQGVLIEMMEMIPILESEERLSNTTVNALGSGNIKKEKSKEILNSWQRIIDKIKPKRKYNTTEEHDVALHNLDHVVLDKEVMNQLYLD